MVRNSLHGCLNNFVCVYARGVRYFGTLIEVGEHEVYLRTDSRWITIAVDGISSIRLVADEELEKPAVEEVDASHYLFSDDSNDGEVFEFADSFDGELGEPIDLGQPLEPESLESESLFDSELLLERPDPEGHKS